MEATVSAVDETKLEQFIGQAVTDMGAAMNGVLVMQLAASWGSGRRWREPGR